MSGSARSNWPGSLPRLFPTSNWEGALTLGGKTTMDSPIPVKFSSSDPIFCQGMSRLPGEGMEKGIARGGVEKEGQGMSRLPEKGGGGIACGLSRTIFGR